MVVLIDNRDSFVFNLARYVEELKYKTTVVRSSLITLKQLKQLNPNYLIISPGPGGPHDAGISLEAIKYYYSRIPILGVCLGHQAIAQAFSGHVIRANHVMHGKHDFIHHSRSGIFKDLPHPLKAARYHSLIIDPNRVPDCLEVIASNKENDIMGVKLKGYPTYGVQFHPESILSESGHDLLQNFFKQKISESHESI